MRQYIFVILFCVVLAAPFVLRAMIVKSDGGHAKAGRGAVRTLVVVTPHNQDIRREFARAFSEWHAAQYGETVDIDFRTPGGTNDIKRQLADTYRAWRIGDSEKGELDPRFVPDVHVAWGGGPFFFDKELKPLNVLQSVPLDPKLMHSAFPQPTLAGVRLYEETTAADGSAAPKWVGICLSAFGIVYNPDIFRGLGVPAPKTWRDLTDPRLAGQLALADPTHSGSAATAYLIILQRRMTDAEEVFFAAHPEVKSLPAADRAKAPGYQEAIAAGWKRGMGELLLIAANARYFGDSSPLVPNDVGNGDAAAGIAIDFYGRVYQEVVGPERCRVVLPAGATSINADPIAILAGVKGEALELSKRFVEYLLSPDAQRLWILKPGEPGGPVERGLRRPPVRLDLYADRTGWTDDVNPFADAHGFNERADFSTLFSDTRPVWTASWIDSREALKTAYEAVLRVPPGEKRDGLIAQLVDLPITMQDVASARSHRKSIEDAGGSAEEWKAKNRIEMVKLFRTYFDRILQEAQ